MFPRLENLCVSRFRKHQDGNVSVFFALALTMILGFVGAAMDYSRLTTTRQYYQDAADRAALAAARVMSEIHNEELPIGQRRRLAKQTAGELVWDLEKNKRVEIEKVSVAFPKINGDRSNSQVTIQGHIKPAIVQMFGHKKLDFTVVSGVSFAESIRPNIDVTMVVDASYSMVNVLRAVQDNILGFQADLEKTLKERDVVAGNLRMKFVFYRDYLVDNHPDWTGPDMQPTSATSEYGAMYSSPFFSVPEDMSKIVSFVNSFTAFGGGDFPENAYEAIWYALKDNDWSNGSENARAIIVWTDAPVRPFGNRDEVTLEENETSGFWRDFYADKFGDSFWDMTDYQRKKFMIDNFYPTDAPSNLSQLKAIYDKFHEENSVGASSLDSMSINILDNCSDNYNCEGWSEISRWNGVDYNFDRSGLDINVSQADIDKVYREIVSQVATMVEEQAKKKKLAISY